MKKTKHRHRNVRQKSWIFKVLIKNSGASCKTSTEALSVRKMTFNLALVIIYKLVENCQNESERTAF